MRTTIVLALSIVLSGCVAIAVAFAPSKAPASSASTDLTKGATSVFWAALEEGRYEDLPEVIEFLSAAYLEHPDDPELAKLLGLAHLWRYGERARLPRQARITEHVVLADTYLEEAHRLAPRDARIAGLHATAVLVGGVMHRDEARKRRGYFELLDATQDLPQFNLFVASYLFGVVPVGDDLFRRAVDSLWQALEACHGFAVDRERPDLRRLGERARSLSLGGDAMSVERRVCANTRQAPHNVEGFFLHMGDVLVKNDQPALARDVYALARASSTHAEWPFRGLLDRRIADAQARARAFRDRAQEPPLLMANSSFACVACHATNPEAAAQVAP